MRIRYYVLAKGQQFEVYRGSISKGMHALRSRAVEAATTMARLETRFTGKPTEVAIEADDGQLLPASRFDRAAPGDSSCAVSEMEAAAG
jgi:hypothetical protein